MDNEELAPVPFRALKWARPVQVSVHAPANPTRRQFGRVKQHSPGKQPLPRRKAATDTRSPWRQHVSWCNDCYLATFGWGGPTPWVKRCRDGRQLWRAEQARQEAKEMRIARCR